MSFRSQCLILGVSFLVGAVLGMIYLFPAFMSVFYIYGP